MKEYEGCLLMIKVKRQHHPHKAESGTILTSLVLLCSVLS